MKGLCGQCRKDIVGVFDEGFCIDSTEDLLECQGNEGDFIYYQDLIRVSGYGFSQKGPGIQEVRIADSWLIYKYIIIRYVIM
jgi:hypothetical protein